MILKKRKPIEKKNTREGKKIEIAHAARSHDLNFL